MGQSQSCLGRCHIYYEGDIGACDHPVETWEIDGPCGESADRPCLSTFNAGWDVNKENCGNCYKVDMKYDGGQVKTTYLRTLDTNGSETKFEMGQAAWLNLCPYVCAGTGVCAPEPEKCEYGIIEGDKNISCTVQNAPITFERVACGGKGNDTTVPATTTNSEPATTTKTEPKTTRTKTEPKTTRTKAEPKTTRTKAEPKTTRTKTEPETTRTKTEPKITTTKGMRTTTTKKGNDSEEMVKKCEAKIKAEPQWVDACREFCTSYAPGNPLSMWCSDLKLKTGEDLIKCINGQQPFCS
ncbi:hypothetical protein GNI_186510 [Gregarina niphandrodes]|uniref:Uncharacterized protein n=1 Tax=Gregarina niphandrodes TaxID=110365 RepID=A0A023AXW5_GRENI|nr:hypothetical protein GNI_186510 [Gregarina niphandrodes]EZG43125.1 hypothetical protein GNI_186510 [Gregarina niphandrodes]|eukprot:XP_011133616.1 hypothetical protein GNI_186510 [Gregarina niphandrodes]